MSENGMDPEMVLSHAETLFEGAKTTKDRNHNAL